MRWLLHINVVVAWHTQAPQHLAERQQSKDGHVLCRSARNLSYQDKLPVEGRAEELLQMKGQDLIGVPLKVFFPKTPCPQCQHLRCR